MSTTRPSSPSTVFNNTQSDSTKARRTENSMSSLTHSSSTKSLSSSRALYEPQNSTSFCVNACSHPLRFILVSHKRNGELHSLPSCAPITKLTKQYQTLQGIQGIQQTNLRRHRCLRSRYRYRKNQSCHQLRLARRCRLLPPSCWSCRSIRYQRSFHLVRQQ